MNILLLPSSPDLTIENKWRLCEIVFVGMSHPVLAVPGFFPAQAHQNTYANGEHHEPIQKMDHWRCCLFRSLHDHRLLCHPAHREAVPAREHVEDPQPPGKPLRPKPEPLHADRHAEGV